MKKLINNIREWVSTTGGLAVIGVAIYLLATKVITAEEGTVIIAAGTGLITLYGKTPNKTEE